MNHSWEYYDEIAEKYDSMYNEPYWIMYHNLLRRLIRDHFKGKGTVLDLGTGTGRWAIDMALAGAEVTAIDPSDNMLAVAANKAKECGVRVTFDKGRGESIDFEECSFDVVVAMGDVLSYTDEPHRVLAEVARVLRADGMIMATVDSGFAFLNDFISNCELKNAENFEAGRRRVLIGDRSASLKSFRTTPYFPSEIRTMITEINFTVLDMAGMIVFGPYSEGRLAGNIDEVTDWEYRYCRNTELLGKAEHIFFCAKKR